MKRVDEPDIAELHIHSGTPGDGSQDTKRSSSEAPTNTTTNSILHNEPATYDSHGPSLPTPGTEGSRSSAQPTIHFDSDAIDSSRGHGHDGHGHDDLLTPPNTFSSHNKSLSSNSLSANSVHSGSSKQSIRPHASSASVSSQASSHSTRSSKFLGSASSVIELKRFFGKGRTKHEEGVSPSRPTERKKPMFSLFGRKSTKKSNATSRSSSPSPSHKNSPSHGGAMTSSTPTPNYPSTPGHTTPATERNNGGTPFGTTPAQSTHVTPYTTRTGDGSTPLEDDPVFVVHGPDYEGHWDPFHVFGLAPDSERLPFLESGITKYGEVGRDMGSGAGGSVRMMARPSDNKLFAVKEFRARRSNETRQKYAKHVTAEYALGAALHHRNIIETIDLLKEGDRYYEVMEYGPHDFFELVMSATMTTPMVDSAFHQIVSGVAYLHSMGVAHRDLKLDNCVVTNDGVVKLIDFGSAVVFKYPMSSQIHLARGILGSDPYLAPEVFSKQPYQPQIADLWSCGIIYCCSYLRRFPWKVPEEEDSGFRRFAINPQNIDGEHPHEENTRKITGPWRLLRLLPIEARSTIELMLRIPIPERITMDQLMKQKWFQQIEEISVLPVITH